MENEERGLPSGEYEAREKAHTTLHSHKENGTWIRSRTLASVIDFPAGRDISPQCVVLESGGRKY
jgi:hypothetical protein